MNLKMKLLCLGGLTLSLLLAAMIASTQPKVIYHQSMTESFQQVTTLLDRLFAQMQPQQYQAAAKRLPPNVEKQFESTDTISILWDCKPSDTFGHFQMLYGGRPAEDGTFPCTDQGLLQFVDKTKHTRGSDFGKAIDSWVQKYIAGLK